MSYTTPKSFEEVIQRAQQLTDEEIERETGDPRDPVQRADIYITTSNEGPNHHTPQHESMDACYKEFDVHYHLACLWGYNQQLLMKELQDAAYKMTEEGEGEEVTAEEFHQKFRQNLTYMILSRALGYTPTSSNPDKW